MINEEIMYACLNVYFLLGAILMVFIWNKFFVRVIENPKDDQERNAAHLYERYPIVFKLLFSAFFLLFGGVMIFWGLMKIMWIDLIEIWDWICVKFLGYEWVEDEED